MSALTIPSVFTAVDKLTGPLKNMTRSMKGFTDTSEAGAARLNRQFRKISNGAKKTAQVSGGIGLAIAAPLALATKSAIDFEKSMSNVATLVDTNKESMSDMGSEVLNLSTKLPVALGDLTESLYDIRSAGIPANAAMAALEASAKLGVAGLGTTSEATNIMTSAMNAFASEGMKASDIQDILFKTVKAGKTNIAALAQAFGSTAPIIQSAGVKLADFQAATAALTTVGTPAAQAQTQLRAAVVALRKPTAEMTKVFKQLGVTSEKELIQKFGGLGGAFKAVNAEGTKLGLNLGKVWSSTEAGAAVTSLTGATQKAYVSTLEDMTKGARAVDEAFAKQNATGASSAQLAENNMKALSITIGTTLIPVFNELIKKVMPVFESFRAWTKENPKTLSTIVKVAAGLAVLAFAISAVSTVVSVVTGAMAAYSLATKGVLFVTKAWSAAQVALNVIMSTNPIGLIIAGVAALIALVAVIITKYDEWGAALSFILGPLGLIINVIQSFRRNWEMITDAFKNGSILDGIKAIGIVLLDSLLMPVQQLLELLGQIPGMDIANKGAESIQRLRENLGVDVNATTSAAPKEALSTRQAEQDGLTSRLEKITQTNVGVTVKDQNNRTDVDVSGAPIPVMTTSTMGIAQ
jgi:TP901 family phage tail tape measure protein